MYSNLPCVVLRNLGLCSVELTPAFLCGVLQLPYLEVSVQYVLVWGILVCQLLLGYFYMCSVPYSGAGKNGSTVAVSLGFLSALAYRHIE